VRCALALLAAAALAAPAAAQPRDEITGEGTEAFRAVVASYKLTPLKTIDEALNDPERTLIISFRGLKNGRPTPDLLEPLLPNDRLRVFVDGGGAVFVATDVRMSDNWSHAFGVSVTGKQVTTSPPTGYQANRRFPFVGPVEGAEIDLFATRNRSPLRVATNKPSCLLDQSAFDTLAAFSDKCGVDNVEWTDGPLPFAQGKQFTFGGRMLVLSDHSVFINSMLLPPFPFPNDNLEFTQNCLDWLTNGPDNTRRDKVLFISDGKIETNFNLIITELPPGTPNEVMKHVLEHPEEALKFLAENPDFRDFLWENRDKASPLLAELEDAGVFSALGESDVFNRSLLSIFPLWVVIRNVLFVATLALLGYAAMKFLGSKWKVVKTVPRLAVVLDRFRPRAGLLEQRLRDGVAAGQYYEAARERAQLLFADLGLSPATEGPPPAYTIAAGWFERSRIDRELRDIWGIAFGTEPRPVTAKAWSKWPSRLAALRDWIQDGVIRFE
jgi:hypothetical protein